MALICSGDFRELRGAVEGLIRHIDRRAAVDFVPAEYAWAEVGAEVTVNGRAVGVAAVFSESVRNRLDFKDLAPCGAELDFAELMALKGAPISIRPVPRFPAVERDLSILVAEETPWRAIAQAVASSASAELEDVRFVDIYRGKGIAPDKKSVTLSLRFRDEDGTLTHEAVDAYQGAIVKGLNDAVGAELRTL